MKKGALTSGEPHSGVATARPLDWLGGGMDRMSQNWQLSWSHCEACTTRVAASRLSNSAALRSPSVHCSLRCTTT